MPSPDIVIYTTPWCPFCIRAKHFLDKQPWQYTEIDVSNDLEKRQEMQQKSQRTSVPQIWINGHHVGGCDDLLAANRNGQLETLIQAS